MSLTGPDSAYARLIQGWMPVLAIRNPVLYAHCYRVARSAVMLGRATGMDEKKLAELEVAARFHDVGLQNVLRESSGAGQPKRAWEAHLKRHPQVGYALLLELTGNEEIANAVWAHHERADGNGFPRKLSQKDIPLFARILAVADYYDINWQPPEGRPGEGSGRNPRSLLQWNKGSALDPELTDLFISSLPPDSQRLREEDDPIPMVFAALRPGMVLAETLNFDDSIGRFPAGSPVNDSLLELVISGENPGRLLTHVTVRLGSIVGGDSDDRQEETPAPAAAPVEKKPAPLFSSPAPAPAPVPAPAAPVLPIITKTSAAAGLSSDLREKARALMEQSTKAYREKNLAAAASLLRQAMAIDPSVSRQMKTVAREVRGEILVVDDSAAVGHALRRELGQERFIVQSVTKVDAALQAMAVKKFDAVIVDLLIGEDYGLDLLHTMESKHPHLACVVLSGNTTADNIRALRERRNVVRFVAKPWSPPLLVAALTEAVERTQANRASA